MRAFLRENLVCPACKGDLDYRQFAEMVDEENGILACHACRLAYPLLAGVPVMLIYKTPLHRRFAERFSEQLAELAYPFSDKPAPKGERHVQRSFTQEWEGLGGDELTFTYTEEELVKLHRDVFLQLDEDDYSASVRSVIDLGCGYGQESAVLSKIFPNADVMAVDINFSVFNGARHFAGNERVHFVLASVFDLPFRAKAFDQVFTQGVIHHTYSTHDAFEKLADLVKPGGHYFVWVYGLSDYIGAPTPLKQIATGYWMLEMGIRPIASRLPAPLQKGLIYGISVATYLPMRMRVRNSKTWRLKNQIHSCYDTFAPRYAWRHATNEVAEWFERRDFRYRFHSPKKYRDLFGKRIFGVGINGMAPV